MTIVYSDKRVDGVDGAYRNPAFFDGLEEGAKVVYTDDESIAKLYKDAGVEVKPITKRKRGKANG